MNREDVSQIVLKAEQGIRFSSRCGGFFRGVRKSLRRVSIWSTRAKSVIIAGLVTIACLLTVTLYLQGRAAKSVHGVETGMSKNVSSASFSPRPTRTRNTILLMLVSCSCLIGIVVRRDRRRQERESRMAGALSRALQCNVLEPARRSRRKPLAPAPQGPLCTVSLSPVPANGQPLSCAGPMLDLKVFMPGIPKDAGEEINLVGLEEEMNTTNGQLLMLIPTTQPVALIAGGTNEQTVRPLRRTAGKGRRSAEFEEIIAEVRKCSVHLGIAHERIRQASRAIGGQNSTAPLQRAMVA